MGMAKDQRTQNQQNRVNGGASHQKRKVLHACMAMARGKDVLAKKEEKTCCPKNAVPIQTETIQRETEQ